MIRVVLADDQSLVRAGFAALLDAEDDIEVVGEGADGEDAVRLAERSRPDVILMDIRMPGLDGIEATRRIAAHPDLGSVHIVIVTTFDLDEYVFEGLRAGAAGFLVKDTDAPELIRAVRVAASGEALLSPTVTRRLISEFASRSRDARHPRGADCPVRLARGCPGRQRQEWRRPPVHRVRAGHREHRRRVGHAVRRGARRDDR